MPIVVRAPASSAVSTGGNIPQSKCKTCTAGKYAKDRTECKNCAEEPFGEGYYSEASASKCTKKEEKPKETRCNLSDEYWQGREDWRTDYTDQYKASCVKCTNGFTLVDKGHDKCNVVADTVQQKCCLECRKLHHAKCKSCNDEACTECAPGHVVYNGQCITDEECKQHGEAQELKRVLNCMPGDDSLNCATFRTTEHCETCSSDRYLVTGTDSDGACVLEEDLPDCGPDKVPEKTQPGKGR